ncbi:Nn.00g017820.m01.CDS01 [Neocucurbitaria sp. VM-36]
MGSQVGLVWKEAWWSIEPAWTAEPDIEVITKIVRRQLKIFEAAICNVEYLAEGSFNKVYVVRCGHEVEYVMRVSLPVQSRFKTMSERTTIGYIRHHTDIPAPLVLFHEATNDNELGFEWMIMVRVPGQKLQERWKSMTWLKKELLVRKFVSYFAQMFRMRFKRLGNLYVTNELQQLPTNLIPDTVLLGIESSTNCTSFCLGNIVSMPFFWNKHLMVDVPRGPFKHSRDWLAARLQLHLVDLEGGTGNENFDPDDELNTYEAVKHRAQRLFDLTPKVFDDETEEFVIQHLDLNMNNILLDKDDEVSGIIDWECVHTVPLWHACQIPRSLRGQDRYEPPNFVAEFENKYYEEAYYDDLVVYEKTQLWKFSFRR